MVPRPHLVRRLDQALPGKLTLISAPAGFGKTTLLKEWVKAYGAAVAWVSLDPGDNDLARLWVHVIAAMQMVQVGLGEMVYAALQGPQPAPIEYLLTDFINEIAREDGLEKGESRGFVLILDDYHLIVNPQVHESLIFFIDHMPHHVHVIISGRADPPWPMARLRARLRMAELRADDFRFTSKEAAALMNDVMGFDISPGDIAALGARTEGWIVGLQMAALSMQKREDKSNFIRAFTGTHRFILDYLLEEVIEQQSPELQEFLLKTAILERMNADLCNTTLGTTNSQALLVQMEQANLFVVPLDDERCWYRYHHLFLELLRNELGVTWPEQLPILHQRASQWHEDHNYPEESIQHALAAQDYERMARLVEKFALGLLHQSRYSVLSGWIETLPDTVVYQRPWLCVFRAWTRHWAGLRQDGDACLLYAENLLDDPTDTPRAGKQTLAGYIALVRAHYALTNEALASTMTQAKKALELLPDEDHFARSTAGIALGGAYWGLGDVPGAVGAFEDCAHAALQGGYFFRASSALCYVGMQQVKQARLKDAESTYRKALDLARDGSGRNLPTAGYPLAKLAELACEWNQLDKAQDHAEMGLELCQQLGHVDLIAEACVALARVQLARRDYRGVIETLQRADTLARETKLDPWAVTWLDDCRVRLWLSSGRLEDAVRWASTSGLYRDQEIKYQHDIRQINLARIQVARLLDPIDSPAPEEVEASLSRLLEAARRVGWIHHQIKIMVLQSLVNQAMQRIEQGAAILGAAIQLAAAGEYQRVFLDEGPRMLTLFQALLTRPAAFDAAVGFEQRAYMHSLMAAFEKVTGAGADTPGLVDPLTAREVDILRLLATKMTVPEIAEVLYVTPNTIRSHVKHIYSKLEVHRRFSAVQKGRELGLI